MKTLVIIFIIIAAISSLSSMTYVAVDIIVEKIKKGQPVPVPAPVQVFVPVPQPEPVVEAAPIVQVDQIDAEGADELMSDDLAMSNIKRESGGGSGFRGTVNIGEINKCFEAGDVVTLADLKAKGLVEKKAGRVKILADGTLEKALTIKADSFSIQAIKMIELTGGTPIILE